MGSDMVVPLSPLLKADISSWFLLIGWKIWSTNVPQSVPRLSEARGLYCEHQNWKTGQSSKDCANAF